MLKQTQLLSSGYPVNLKLNPNSIFQLGFTILKHVDSYDHFFVE